MAQDKTYYQLPEGVTWRDVVTVRVKSDIPENYYPLAIVPGQCTAWGTVTKAVTGLEIDR